ncbi:unnamed protein product [Acanthoscelides obtectus]|uniref:Transposase n=1 Tax=Acanthoscelides obtectus TaxID=200917 RepID=A0A9P0PK11_ACAOB|nr:unnamed protein product [Acanthoscelides obtectus]CAK1662489.1 hypothetical protein AOBTE_LOCUS23170 [Acanthoscelides obtectus]
MFSHEEKCDMLECYLVCRKSSLRAREYYSELYPARIQPYERYFLRLYRKFRGNENVFAKTRAKKEFIISEATEIAVIGYFEAYRENSIADILKDSNFSYGTVQRILKKYKFIPYKYRPVQTLLAGDPERRLVFCHWYLSFCRQNVNNFRYLLWTDESNFSNSGMFNRKNHHYWSRENLLLVHPRGPQVRFSFNVWCGIIGSKIVGPFFYEGTLTGERYVEFMSEILTNFLDELDLISRHHLHFQQDGAPAHNSRGTYHFLSTTFNDQWIGTNGPIQWPPRSPDLNPLDYFLWGYLKNQIYKRRYDNLDALKTAVREKITQIDGRTILKTVRAVEKRAQKCIEEQVITELRKINPERRIILHQDNASSHTAQKTKQYLTEENVELLDHPPYSPDLSPNDFFTFRNLKTDCGWNKCFENWLERMQMCQRKATINSTAKKNRLRWAKEHRQWTPQQWCAIQWSDEARFEVMVWGSMSSKEVGKLHFIDGNVDTNKYLAILEESLLPVMDECLTSGQDFVFQQDGAACHTSKKAIKWMEKNNVPLLKWVSSSPDLSPIETLWHEMKKVLRQHPARTITKLRQKLQ